MRYRIIASVKQTQPIVESTVPASPPLRLSASPPKMADIIASTGLDRLRCLHATFSAHSFFS
ncbi:hypothetical protein OAF59_01770, partial [bacterium]|nr:hypothetical protein [bacterium]